MPKAGQNKNDGKQDWRKTDPRVLGQILAAQNILFVLPDTTRIASFFAQALVSVPGVISCRVCLGNVSVQVGLDSDVCRECEVLRRVADEPYVMPFGFQCRLADQRDIRILTITLETSIHTFGFFVFRTDTTGVFESYSPFINNLANYVALSLENRLQKYLLQKSEEKFRDIYSESPIGIEIYDSHGALLDVNEACLDIFGVADIEDVRGFILFEDPNVTDAVKLKLSNGETVRYEAPFDFDKVKEHRLYNAKKSGIIHLDVLVTPLGLRGNVASAGYLVQVQDVTARKLAEDELNKYQEHLEEIIEERSAELMATNKRLYQEIDEHKRAEEALHKSETRFRQTLDFMLEGCMIIGFDWTYLYLNETAAQHGLNKRENLIGRTMLEMYPGVEQSAVFARYRRCMVERIPQRFEESFSFADGTTMWYMFSVEPIPEGIFVLSQDITERKQIEERLVQQSKTLDSFFKCAITPLAILDRHFNFVRVNEAYAAAGHRDVSEFLGHNHFEFYPSDARMIFEEVVETKSPYQTTERPFIYPDHPEWGVSYWDWTLTPILSDTGEVEFLVLSLKDVTKLKQTDEKLRESERVTAILNRIANVFLTVSDEEVYREVLSVVLDVMGSRCGIFGFIADNGDLVIPSMTQEVWSKCQVPDKSIIFPPHTWGGSLWGRAIREQSAFYSNVPFHVPEGHIPIHNFLAVPVIFRDKTIGLLSVGNKGGGYTEEDKELMESFANAISPILNARLQRDSQERQRATAEDSLNSLVHKTSLILDSAGEGIYGTDLDGKVTFVNPAAAQMLGYEVEELIGGQTHATWHHSYPDGTPFPIEQCRLHQVLRQGIPCVTSSVVFWRKDGTKFPVDCSSTPMFEAGTLMGAVVIFRDIEEKTRLENQLRQAQKMEAIGTLAGGVAHDYNNLTTIILAYADMLLGELPPDDPGRKYAEQIVKAGERSAALTRQLLAFSRKQPLLPKVLDLSALLLDYEKMLGRLIGEDIQLEFRLAADAGCVTADPGQIEQIITNLVVNARDAMPRGGRLTVETAAVELAETQAPCTVKVVPGRYVRLTVSDNGVGMDQATLARLFEPFFTTKEKGKGTGLGLATAHGIVKQSGGYIWAASEPGKGTTFTIHLPWTDAKSQARPVRGVEEAPRRGNGERVLLVEDEEALRGWCETALTRLGYRVSTAANGQEALNLVREQGLEPDLVVTDLVMPEMSGFELADRLREKRPDLGVLYMSGYPDETIARHGVIAPGMSFLLKPFSVHDLAKKAHEALAAAGTGGRPVARPGRRVLMIDDDEQYRELVRHSFTKRGHFFAGVDSAAAALAALAAQPCDVLLVDLNIPGTSGEQVLREIRAAGHAAPAIVLTGDVASADMDELRPLGVVRAIGKSSDSGPLLRAIEEDLA